jgi:tetratricopeptide (TPR) repeat protein
MNVQQFFLRNTVLAFAAVVALAGCERNPAALAESSTAAGHASPAQVADAAQDTTPAPVQRVGNAGCRENKLQLVELLRTQRVAELDKRLGALHLRVLAGDCSDRWLGHAFTAFQNTDPVLAPSYAQWLRTTPRSAYALTARGIYRMSIGWHNRGGAWAQDTPADQVESMEQHFVQASSDLRDAVAIMPTLTPAHAQLIELASASAGPLQDFPLYRRAMEAAPQSFEVHRAALKRLQPKWGGSEAGLAHYLSLVRDAEELDPELSVLRGYRYFTAAEEASSQRQFKRALKLVDRALALGDDPRARARRAMILSALKRDSEAATEWRRLIETHMLESKSWFGLGQIALRRGEHDKAIEAFSRSLSYDGGNPNSLRARARAYAKTERIDAALADLALAAAAAPSRFDIAAAYAEHLYAAKRGEQALAVSERALALNPQNARAWRYHGLIAIQRKDAANALAAFDRAIALTPHDAQPHYERAWVRHKLLGDAGAALPDYRKAAELQTDSARYWYALAESAYGARDCDVVTATRRYVELCAAGKCANHDRKRIAWAQRESQDAAYARRCPREYAES